MLLRLTDIVQILPHHDMPRVKSIMAEKDEKDRGEEVQERKVSRTDGRLLEENTSASSNPA